MTSYRLQNNKQIEKPENFQPKINNPLTEKNGAKPDNYYL